MDRERVKLNAIWSLHLQVHWRNRHWLSPGLLFKHTCKCGSYATAHSVHERDGGFCEGKAEAGRDLDEVGGGGGGEVGAKSKEKLHSSRLPRFYANVWLQKMICTFHHENKASLQRYTTTLYIHPLPTPHPMPQTENCILFTCLVLTLFSLSCLCRALTIDCIWVVRRFTGLKPKNKSTVHVYTVCRAVVQC